jgi:hypothetical protein
VNDPFCTASSQALWSVSVDKKECLNLLLPIQKIISTTSGTIYFRYPYAIEVDPDHGIELNLSSKRIFQPESAYFSIKDDGRLLCSMAGDMDMVSDVPAGSYGNGPCWLLMAGYLHFYFHNVTIADYREMDTPV